jgi:hypothetical protein
MCVLSAKLNKDIIHRILKDTLEDTIEQWISTISVIFRILPGQKCEDLHADFHSRILLNVCNILLNKIYYILEGDFDVYSINN